MIPNVIFTLHAKLWVHLKKSEDHRKNWICLLGRYSSALSIISPSETGWQLNTTWNCPLRSQLVHKAAALPRLCNTSAPWTAENLQMEFKMLTTVYKDMHKLGSSYLENICLIVSAYSPWSDKMVYFKVLTIKQWHLVG